MDIFGSLNTNSQPQPTSQPTPQPMGGPQYPQQFQQVLGKMSMPVPGMYPPMNPAMIPTMNPAMGYRPQVQQNVGIIPSHAMNAMGGFIKTTSPTIIPTPAAPNAAPSSGFSFIGGGEVKKSTGDSFSFVTDEINKASQKK